MDAFHSGRATTLVATDIAARGIHVDDVALVVHADPPAEHKAYLHRSGRTARAGAAGTVITLMTQDQVRDVRDLTRAAGIKPTITRVDGPRHPMLTTLAPGERVLVAGGLGVTRRGARASGPAVAVATAAARGGGRGGRVGWPAAVRRQRHRVPAASRPAAAAARAAVGGQSVRSRQPQRRVVQLRPALRPSPLRRIDADDPAAGVGAPGAVGRRPARPPAGPARAAPSPAGDRSASWCSARSCSASRCGSTRAAGGSTRRRSGWPRSGRSARSRPARCTWAGSTFAPSCVRPVVTPIALGLALAGVFVAGALRRALRLLASGLEDQVVKVIDFADQGSLPLLVVITAVNGIAEELFFRGAAYAAIPRHPVLWTTVAYVIATARHRQRDAGLRGRAARPGRRPRAPRLRRHPRPDPHPLHLVADHAARAAARLL